MEVSRLIAHAKTALNVVQLVDTLSLLLPGSEYFPLLSGLPAPDATNPDATSTFYIQSAIHNSLPILEQLVEIIETREGEEFTKEVARRRTRLGAGGPEAVKREVGTEIWGSSRVGGGNISPLRAGLP